MAGYIPKVFLFLSAAAIVVAAGCSSSDITSPGQIVFPASGVSYGAQVQPLFTLACATSGCHDSPRNGNNNVDLTSYFGAMTLNCVDQPGDTTCGLIRVVYGREIHQGPVIVNDNQRVGLKQWVIEGARNN